MAIQGILQGLGGEAEAGERARQQTIVETLAQAQESRSKAEEARRQRLSDIQTRQLNASVPQGQPYRAADGKVYQRMLDPNTGAISTKEITEPEEESIVGGVIRQIKQAEASGIKLSDEEKQRMIEAALGGRAMLTNPPKPNRAWSKNPDGTFTSFMVDPYTNQEIPGTRNTGMTPPAQYLERVRTGEFTYIDESGVEHRVPTTTTSGPRVPTSSGGGAAGGGARPAAPKKAPAAPAGAGAGAGAGAPGSESLPRGSRTIGQTQNKAVQAEAVRQVKVAEPMVNLLDASEAYFKSGQYTPRQDLAIVVRAVRAMNPGSVRLPQKELDLEIRAGSFGDRFKRWYTNAFTGLLPADQRKDLMTVIRSEAETVARSAAATWLQNLPGRPLPPNLQRFAPSAQPGGSDSNVIVVTPEEMNPNSKPK